MADPTTKWSPAAFLTQNDTDYALVILNQPIDDRPIFETLWKHATYKVCADGGANRLYDAVTADERPQYIPSCITGDLDSVRADVLAYYATHSVPVVRDIDQYATDFTKCLKWLDRQVPSTSSTDMPPNTDASPLQILALGALGGRVDQSFHSIHQLYVAGTSRKILLISSESITFLLHTGRNEISTPMELLGPTCGIIPVGGVSVLTTKGLEWDLEGTETRFGGMVSTSNHLKAEMVVVESSERVLFTVEIRR